MSREEEEEEEEGWVDERDDSGVGDGLGDGCVWPLRMKESNLEMSLISLMRRRKEKDYFLLFIINIPTSALSTA